MDNKIIFLTGSSSGIGWELLKKLLKEKHFLILPIRNYQQKEHLKELVKIYKDNIDVIEMDLGNLNSLTNQNIWNKIKQYPRIDILINNAGIYTHTKHLQNGIELQWLVNYIAPAYLSLQLVDLLSKSNSPLVLFVSSRMHYMAKVNFEDLQYSKHYSGQLAYANSKFAITSFSLYFAERFKNIRSNSCHPGVYSTGITRDLPFLIKFLWNTFIPGPKEGSEVLYQLLFNPEFNQQTGKYFDKLKISQAHKDCYNKEIQQKLLDFLEQATGIFI